MQLTWTLAKRSIKVPHNLLLLKLKSYGISDPTLSWFGSYLSERQQQVVINGHSSDWLPVTLGIPQGSILGPLLFLIYINNLPTYLENNSSIALYADDSKLFRPIYLPNDSFSLQKHLNSLSHWGKNWAMAFNVSKCKVVHFSRKKLPIVHHLMGKNYYLAGNQLENVPNILDLGITTPTTFHGLNTSKRLSLKLIELLVLSNDCVGISRTQIPRSFCIVLLLDQSLSTAVVFGLLTQVNIVYLSKMFSEELPGLFLITLKICHIH